jgi:hypothetical protein
MKEKMLVVLLYAVCAIFVAGIIANSIIVSAAPPVPSIGVVRDVLACSEIQGSPTIIRFIDQVRTADGNRLTIICYSRTTADGEGDLDCVAGR